MNFKTISRTEFNQLLPHNPALKNLMIEQVEPFSNKSGNLLGTIAGECVAGWNYVILKRDNKGDFRIHKVMGNFFSSTAARVDLLISMAEIAIDKPDLRVLFTSVAPSQLGETTALSN